MSLFVTWKEATKNNDNKMCKELEKEDTVYMDALDLMLRLDTRDKLPEFLDRLKVLADCLTDQVSNVYVKVGNTSQAHVLLEGLKSRTCNMNNKKQQLMQKAIQVSFLAEAVYEYGKGNNTKALEMLGPNFDVIYHCVLNTGFAAEKSYLMEGNAEAVVTTCEKANVLESSYFKFS
ncbi:unnamed protein product [Brassica napus]|uniref:(rape) hypothetical protein n=1 Tax=Brassica napus TaxID=3708 RepID=A0A816MFE8_BRANA|nr:unnamed protein product [Brassica napus]